MPQAVQISSIVVSDVGLKLPLTTLLDSVASRVTPGQQERDFMDGLASKLTEKVGKILSGSGFKADVSVQGSVAKDTWLHREGDLDIFASLPTDLERGEWEDRVLPVLRKGLSEYSLLERYAEHPYLEFETNKVRVNVVPCYNVKQGNWKSATDRTPFHTTYMREHLNDQLKREVRILKKFMKGVGVYGAEIRVGGFSGMLVETITLRYGSFVKILESAMTWRTGSVIEVEPSGREEEQLRRKFDSPLIVVDPVDPNRNLAAAVRTDKLWEFVAIARQFTSVPAFSYFYPGRPRQRSRKQLLRRLSQSQSDYVVVVFPHSHVVLDILWAQLYSLEKSLVGLAERHEFQVLRSGVWGDAEKISGIILVVESAQLPESQIHLGPPVERKQESEMFLERHVKARDTLSGPWISGNRWMVEKRRPFQSLPQLIVAAAKDPKLGLAVPAQLEQCFRKKVRMLQNEKTLFLSKMPEFAETLWRFMDGKPDWLKTRDS
jgi:tRNA nucleotidyltransferase (CCA-adding enzyme)